MTKEEIAELNLLYEKSTMPTRWYPHAREVRGPFLRWFKITEVPDDHKKDVASERDDLNYCAAAMNSVPGLIKTIYELQAEIVRLKLDSDSVATLALDKLK